MTEEKRVLKFAIMSNTAVLQQWQRDVLDILQQSSYAVPVLLIMPEEEQVIAKSLVSKMIHYNWHQLFFRQYYRHFFRPKAFSRVDSSDIFGKLTVLRCRVKMKGRFSQYFEPADIEKIEAHHPDFILKFGFGIIRGDILKSAPYGIWSFHHGDEQKYRGVPPAFWEIVKKDEITGAILQRLTESLDDGIILRKGFFPTINHSWQANLDQVIQLSKSWPAEVCHEIVTQQTFPSESDSPPTNAEILKEPENYTFMQFLFMQAFNKIYFHFREMFAAEKWQTGLMKARTAEVVTGTGYLIDKQMVHWLSAGGADRYYADGFVIREQERLLALFEAYDYRTRKAGIAASWFSERDAIFTPAVPVLEEDWHLSYPFTFRHDDVIYCVPESLSHGAIELYRFDVAGMKLLHERTLVPDMAAADPTLVFHQNHWYLFFTPAHATNIELHIWHADTLDGPFVPHELNPVKSDISNARPAGALFSLDGNLYRPAQDCSHTYGGRIIINEIKVLSETSFLEMPVSTLEPPPGFKGIHNLSFSGDYMYFDCKRERFSPASFKWQLFRRLGLVSNKKGGSR
ncbi:MAG: hypothetical protein M9948_10860 [Lentimicrobium sp.]|nr:hypothetical protein [Lentimicrobium sp.]